MPAERMIGNYVLGPLLGRGGMSEVRSATHQFLDQRVAIKLLRASATDGDLRAAFLAEATQTRAIDHPGVVRVIDVGRDGDDFYLVMEHLEGETLATRLARAIRLDEPSVRRLGAAIADGAAAAHASGIIHRDLKPGNIMLVGPGGDQPKIVDFGIARQLDHLAAKTTGSRTGTPAYMAPEQLTGGLIAPCVDIWALGAILYEALAGRLPFEGYANGRCPQLFETPRRLGDFATVSPALEALIASCLDRDPARRPPSMAAIARALRGEAAEDRITEDVAPENQRAMPGLEPQPARVHDLGAGAASDAAMVRPGARPDAPSDARPDARPGARPDAPSDARPDAPPDASAAGPRRSVRRRIEIASLTAIAILAAVTLAWRWRETSPRSAAAEGAPPSSGASPTASPDLASTPGNATASTEPTPASAPGDSPATDDDLPAEDSNSSSSADREAAAALPSDPQPGRWSAPFTVLVRSAPAGASVIVDGKRVGVTPASIALRAPAQVLVTRRGYQPTRVRAERAGPILVRLVPLPRARDRRPPAGETLD